MTCKYGKLRYTAPLQLLQLFPKVNPVAILMTPLEEVGAFELNRLGVETGITVLTGGGAEVMNLILSIL